MTPRQNDIVEICLISMLPIGGAAILFWMWWSIG